MKKREIAGEYFCGNRVSKYGRDHGYLDYGTFAKAFDAVLCNPIADKYCLWDDIVQGFDDEDVDFPEIFQYYIVSDAGAELIKEYTDDPLFYVPDLYIYVWGITHYGTSWEYVLTDVEMRKGETK